MQRNAKTAKIFKKKINKKIENHHEIDTFFIIIIIFKKGDF